MFCTDLVPHYWLNKNIYVTSIYHQNICTIHCKQETGNSSILFPPNLEALEHTCITMVEDKIVGGIPNELVL